MKSSTVPVAETRSDTRRRILFVHQSNGLGGAPTSLFNLISEIDPTRYCVALLLIGNDSSVLDYFRKLRIEIHQSDGITFAAANGVSMPFTWLKPWTYLSFVVQFGACIRNAQRFLRQCSFDLVYLNTSVLTPFGIAARRSGKRVLWHIREELSESKGRFWYFLSRTIINSSADQIISISETNKSRLRNPNVIVVYNYVAFERFDRRISGYFLRRELNIPDGDSVLLMLGGAVHSKGLHVLLNAFSIVSKTHSRTHLIIAGHGLCEKKSPFSSRVRNWLQGRTDVSGECRMILARNPHLEKSTTFLGFRDDIPELLAACDMLIWPATVSHFARPIMEAFAMARPVIASDFESTREILHDGYSGLLFKPGSVEALAKKIIYIIENVEHSKEMAENGHKFAHLRFDREVNSKKILAAIENLIDK